MLILVVVTIRISTKGGLFDYAGKAARETKDAIADEKDIADGKITTTVKEHIIILKEY